MSETGAVSHPGATTSEPLAWLGSVLWPDRGVWSGVGDPPAGSRVVASYVVVPDPGAPRVLVPRGAPRAAAAALRQFNQGMPTLARVRKAAAGFAFRVGAGERVAGAVLRVATTDHDASGIEGLLRDGLGVPDALLAITIGALRPNIKPVICVLRPSGRAVAFAKVAWNPLTRELVEREQDALRVWNARPPRTFAAPRPLASLELGGFPVGVVAPAPQPLVRRGPATVPLEVVREIAGRGAQDRGSIAANEGWAALRSRIDRASASGPLRSRAAGALDATERRWGSAIVPFGSWHGDFAPWNTTWHRGRWTVWDWERSGEGVPVGLDAIHWQVQVASHAAGGRDLARAVRRVQPGVERALASLDAGAPDAVVSWYLAERFARYEEARAAGTLDPAERRPEACLSALEELS